MAQPPYSARNAFTGRLPDRTLPTASQPQFGQSAPGLGRQTLYGQLPPPPPPQTQPTYGTYPPYTSVGGYAIPRGPMQTQAGGAGMGTEKESNAVNDLSDEQRDEINEAFSIFDLDKDRHLDFHEFKVAMRALGFDLDKTEVSQILGENGVPKQHAQQINAGIRGKPLFHPSQMLISHNVFTRIAAQKIGERDPMNEVERAFYLFDGEHKGYISLDDLRRVTQDLGETSLEEQELRTMIDEFDYEGIGGISKEAFIGICLQ